MKATDNIVQLKNILAFKAPLDKPTIPYQIGSNAEVIELITAGKVYFDRGNGRELFGAGTMFWHLRGDETIYDSHPEDPYQCITFTFSTHSNPIRQVPRCTIWRDKAEVELFVEKVINAYFNNECDRDILSSYVYSHLLWEAYESHITPTSSDLPDSLNSLLDYIDRNLAKEWSLKEMAGLISVSIPSLHLLFRNNLNKSPHQYMLNRRIQEAKTLLATSDLPVKEICYLCGFKNEATFYRVFKKQLNITPLKYREDHLPPGYKAALLNFHKSV